MTITPEAREAAMQYIDASVWDSLSKEHQDKACEPVQLAINSAVSDITIIAEKCRIRELEQIQELAEKDKEIERLKHIIECAKTPLMADVMRERDAYLARIQMVEEYRVNDHLKSRLAKLEEIADRLAKATDSMLGIVSESQGITGWHLNGDVLNWEQCEPIEEMASAHSAYQQYKEAK